MYPPRSIAICLILLCGGAAPALHAQETLYLKERVAVTTKVGVTGLAPGTRVRLISENGNALRVTDGTTTFDVPKNKLTDNVSEAKFAAQNYYAAEQAGAQAFNAEVVRQQQERKRALEQQQKAAAEQRQRQMQQEQIAAQQEQRQIEAQRKQEAKIAAQKQAREQQQRPRRTTGGLGDHWENWKRTFPGGYEERSGDARMGHYHSESHGPFGSNTTTTSWYTAPKRNKAKKRETPSP
jgi:hypothetical protein